MECPSCHATLPDGSLFCLKCGARAPDVPTGEAEDPTRAALRKALGQQYEMGRLLGKGGMAAVYLATEAALAREVAIKVLPPDRGATKDSRERFRREARTAARLSHPNIVPLYTFGDVDGTLYFVMGYVKGESLAARLKREGRLPVEDARRILIEIADALEYAHKLGVIHRDIKPDNVLLEEGTGRALLTDFGVAKALGAGQTMTEVGSILGTPQYMSPEQAQGKSDIDNRSDLYSLGVMGYAMLAGRLPFEGPTAGDIMAQHITKEAPALKSLAPDAGVGLASAVMRSLAKNPNDRWPDALALKSAISLSTDKAPVPAPLIPIWRGAKIVAIASVVTVFVWANASMTPEPMDPLASRLAIDGLPRLTLGFLLIVVVAMAGAALEARRLGHVWPEIFRAAVLKPVWWLGWYPVRWRARNDLWHRLPAELRRARALLGVAVIVFPLWVSAVTLISSNASNFYQLTGRETVVIRVDRFLKSNVGRGIVVPPIAMAVAGLFLAFRWTKSASAAGLRRELAGEMLQKDTAHPTFWSRPDIAALLLPSGVSPGSSTAPSSAQELNAAISAALSQAGTDLADVRDRAREVARGLTKDIAALDHQIGALGSAVDPAEAKRLVDRLDSLGPDRGPNDLNREIREILQKQLDAVRSLQSRIEEARSRRAQRLEQLRILWTHTNGLFAPNGGTTAGGAAVDRLRRVLTEIQNAAGSGGTLPGGATEDIREAPTLGR